MRRTIGPVVFLVSMLVFAACADSGDDAAESTTSSVASTTTTPSSTASVVASTVSTSSTTTEATTTTSAPTTTSETTEPSTTTTTEAPATTEILVIEGGVHEFTSPSGNIACVMSATSASCWISEKNWTIDQPPGPDCAISDWGNVVELAVDGPFFPCYTDMGWNPFAPAMSYGTAVELGTFRCDSAESGVTCRNEAGQGFSVARAAVNLF